MAELTPMMKQYLEIKKDNPDSILFFRLGDFYEMFADDAKLASRELDLTLTSRDHGKHAKPEPATNDHTWTLFCDLFDHFFLCIECHLAL